MKAVRKGIVVYKLSGSTSYGPSAGRFPRQAEVDMLHALMRSPPSC